MEAEVFGTLHGVLVLKGFMDRDLALETMKLHRINVQVVEPVYFLSCYAAIDYT